MNNNFNYAIFPLQMLENDKYKSFSSKEFFLYMLLLNRKKLSQMNEKIFSDKNGFFIYYSNEQIAKHLRCNKSTAIQVLKNLENSGLIRKEHQKRGLPLKIYVYDIISEQNETDLHTATNKTVSFDIEKAKQKAIENRYDFGTKKNKRRTR
ncbi:MAG: replication initiator protein A [Clostridia bacterium]|nr:replication initiator protein A [Clostridia bacterium]